MTADATPYDAWARDWLDTQRRAWQAWLDGDLASPPAGDPADALAGWLDGEAASLGGEVGERLLDQGRLFLQLAEALGQSLAEAARAGTPPDWPAVFDSMLDRVRATLEPDPDGTPHPAGALGGLLDAWGEVARGLDLPENAAPAVYVTALHAYGARLADVQRDALDRLRHELDEQHADGAIITSLRTLYDLWVDVSEAAYAEAAASEGFASAQAELVHALCRLHPATRSAR